MEIKKIRQNADLYEFAFFAWHAGAPVGASIEGGVPSMAGLSGVKPVQRATIGIFFQIFCIFWECLCNL